MFDPDRGARRRALLRDKLVLTARKTRDGVDATARDLAHRTRGLIAATRGRFVPEQVDDATLTERVRARLGRVSLHAHALDVLANDGEIILRGPILAEEMPTVLAAINRVRGVKCVVNELEPHASAEGVPSLQGRGRRAGPSIEILQRHWAPATRALVAVAGVAAGVSAVAYARR
jgi:hypothetical protein